MVRKSYGRWEKTIIEFKKQQNRFLKNGGLGDFRSQLSQLEKLTRKARIIATSVCGH